MIKAHIVDAGALAARTPVELSTYLRSSGWRPSRRTEAVAYWERSVDGGELEILQPLDQDLRDYALRIGDALVTLAAAERRSELEVLRAISSFTWDVHTVRLFPPNAEAAAEFRARTPEEDVAVVGDVVRLHREGAGGGEVTVVGRVAEAEALRRIWIDLPAEHYEVAMRAHQETRPVTVRGNLVRRGTRFYLSRATGFRTVTDIVE